MNPTPTVYVFYPIDYTTIMNGGPPPNGGSSDGQLSVIIIVFIAFAAFIALFILLCLIVVIYNFCTYGSCCPPSGNSLCICCRPISQQSAMVETVKPTYMNQTGTCCCCFNIICCRTVGQQPTVVEVINQPTPVIQTVRSSPYVVGSYVSRAPRISRSTYIAEPAISRSGTLSLSAGRLASRRNSIVIVEDGGTSSRRRPGIQSSVRRPQIIVCDDQLSAPGRIQNIGRQDLIALPSASSSSDVRCFARNEPVTSGSYYDDRDDGGDIRVIVRNQPYTSQQRQTIIDAPVDMGSCISSPPAFDSLTMNIIGGGGGGGGAGSGMGLGNGMSIDYGVKDADCNCTYGYDGMNSTTAGDVGFDQTTSYSLSYNDNGGHQNFQQTSIYPDLGRSNCY